MKSTENGRTNMSTAEEIIARMGGKALVRDGATDEHETAERIEIVPLAAVREHIESGDGGAAMRLATEIITDRKIIRALYDHPTAQAYGDGSYTVGDGESPIAWIEVL